MKRYIIQNDPNRFGFLVETNPLEFALEFKVFKISAEGEETFEVELTLDGSIKWDGCSNLRYGEDGYIHFCESDDWICFNKSMEFLWKMAEGMFKDNGTFDVWIEKETVINEYDGEYEIAEY